MDGTILSQGSFTAPATIVNVNIPVPSGVDWVSVVNYTRQGTVGGANRFGFEYFWQRGMASGSALLKYYANAGAVVTGDLITSGGISLYDPTNSSYLSSPVAVTAITNATRPVLSTGSTAGISVGSVVRVSSSAQTDVNGVDMIVGAFVANTSITLLAASNALATAPGLIGGAGFYRIVNTDSLFYPRRRVVTNITRATNAQVSTALEHSLTVGQQVRLSIPLSSGMIELNSSQLNNFVSATVVSIVDAYNFTINIDTTGFTAFTYPTAAQVNAGSNFPEVVPFGENTAVGLTANNAVFPQYQGQNVYNAKSGILADATVNTAFLGMTLGTGGTGVISTAAITGPAGSVAGDVIYWRVGKSTYGGL